MCCQKSAALLAFLLRGNRGKNDELSQIGSMFTSLVGANESVHGES